MNERFKEYIPEEDVEYTKARDRLERIVKTARIIFVVAQTIAIVMEKSIMITLMGLILTKIWDCPKMIAVLVLVVMTLGELLMAVAEIIERSGNDN